MTYSALTVGRIYLEETSPGDQSRFFPRDSFQPLGMEKWALRSTWRVMSVCPLHNAVPCLNRTERTWPSQAPSEAEILISGACLINLTKDPVLRFSGLHAKSQRNRIRLASVWFHWVSITMWRSCNWKIEQRLQCHHRDAESVQIVFHII
jgi:hypothetical protein